MWNVYWLSPYGTREHIDTGMDYDALLRKYAGEMFEITEVG